MSPDNCQQPSLERRPVHFLALSPAHGPLQRDNSSLQTLSRLQSSEVKRLNLGCSHHSLHSGTDDWLGLDSSLLEQSCKNALASESLGKSHDLDSVGMSDQ